MRYSDFASIMTNARMNRSHGIHPPKLSTIFQNQRIQITFCKTYVIRLYLSKKTVCLENENSKQT